MIHAVKEMSSERRRWRVIGWGAASLHRVVREVVFDFDISHSKLYFLQSVSASSWAPGTVPGPV